MEMNERDGEEQLSEEQNQLQQLRQPAEQFPESQPALLPSNQIRSLPSLLPIGMGGKFSKKMRGSYAQFFIFLNS